MKRLSQKVNYMKIRKITALFIFAMLCIGLLTITAFAASYEITADSTEADVYAAFGLTADEDKAKLEVNIETKTLTLKDDLTLTPPDTIKFKSGNWVLLGNGHTLTFAERCFVLKGDATLKLGGDGKELTLVSDADTQPVCYLDGSSKLYMY